MVTCRKERVLGIWVNADSRVFDERAGLSRGAGEPAARRDRQRRDAAPAAARPRERSAAAARQRRHRRRRRSDDPFRLAFLRLKSEQRLYREAPNGVTFLTPTLFRASIPLPAEVPVGTYEVDVKLFADGAMIARAPTRRSRSYKVGFEQFVANAARDHGLLYGLATAMMASVTGWLAVGGVPAGLMIPRAAVNQPGSARQRSHRAAARPAYAR